MSEEQDNVVELSEKSFTPKHVLNLLLQEDDLQDLVVCWKSKDDVLYCMTSHMRLEMLALLSKRLDLYIDDFMYASSES